MYIAKSTSKSASGKVYESVLLRESYRENGKVKNRTLANLSKSSKNEIEAIQFALKNKDNLKTLSQAPVQIFQGKSIGSVFILNKIAERLGITKALGNSFHAKLTLWLVFARIIEQGSRLSAVRLDPIYDIASIIKLNRGFDENDFYESLHWVAKNQKDVENYLFQLRKYSDQFYWYDVTSSYFEGTQNALAAYGHNRDKKKRKKQIVVGLLTINDGMPISVEAFAGNTQDTQTFQSQLEKLKSRFGCKNVILIGDRGMIRKKQKLLAKEYGYKFITALTLPEVNSLLNAGCLTIEHFKAELQSFCVENTRYIYRRNPGRAEETQRQRQERLATAQKRVDQENAKLRLKPKTSAHLSKYRTKKYLARLCINEWVDVYINKRELHLRIDQEKLNERAKFDGCYVWTTELGKEEATDREVYDRYKDLKHVEDDFRTFKTNFLEIRPIHVRTPGSTKGHLFITMLAHMIVRELRGAWCDMNITVQEGLRLLSLICQNSIRCSDNININMISEPSKEASILLEALNIKLPKTIEIAQVRVVTRHQTKKAS
jgi:hypothetical protein